MGDIIKNIGKYYSDKIETFGMTPQGVDWNSNESQHLRFEVLSRLMEGLSDFSVLDYGCGFGSMFPFLNKKFNNIRYTGFDISEKMIQAAQTAFQGVNNAAWFIELGRQKSDFVVASGIFNVRLEHSDEEWLAYILKTITALDRYSEKGFAFNILTSYSDKEFMKDYLYYADPLFLFDFCKRNFSRNVALLHDYNLYEFTILVKK